MRSKGPRAMAAVANGSSANSPPRPFCSDPLGRVVVKPAETRIRSSTERYTRNLFSISRSPGPPVVAPSLGKLMTKGHLELALPAGKHRPFDGRRELGLASL